MQNIRFLSIILSILLIFINSSYAENQKLSIGVIIPLTGELSAVGKAIQNGIELAKQNDKSNFSNLEIIYEDDQLDGKKSITAYRKLKNSNNVFAIIGFGIVFAEAVAPLAERDQIPIINLSFVAEPAVGKKYLIRSMNHTAQYMDAFVEHITYKNIKELAYIKSEYSFFNIMTNDLKNSLGKEYKIKEFGSYNPSDLDFRSSIIKMKNETTGPIGLYLLPNQILTFLKQAKELKLNRSYYGIDLFETAAMISKNPDLVEGAIYPDNNVSEVFRSIYSKKFNNESQLTFAGASYDMINVINSIIKNKGIISKDQFLRGIESVSKEKGVLGEFSFKNTKEKGKFFEYPIHIKQINNSRGVLIPKN